MTFNTTASFVTNTNWQFYGGETTLSYFSQMAGLAVQNFVSAAVGMAVLAAVIRGFASRGAEELGNFWQDLTRTLLYILLPLSLVGALVLVSQGVDPDPQRLRVLHDASRALDQTLALGPAASQIAIKQLGTNGGGFFNVNSAMPFENPTHVLELRRGAVHPADPGGADRHVRAHGGQPPPGLGPLRGDGGDARGRHRRRLRGGAERLAGPEVGRRGRGVRRRHHRRQPRGQGAALRHRQQRRCGPRSPPPPRTARSTRPTTPTPASAAACRWPT